jgi:ornithine cyclodeaminase
MKTLILTHSDISTLIDIDALRGEFREGFIRYSDRSSRRDGKRTVLDIGSGNTTTLLGPGTSSGIPAYTIKVNSKFPNTSMPIKGAIALFDIENGNLLALLDSGLITAVRTGLCAAMATDLLADPKAGKVGVVGAGRQNTLQLKYLLRLRRLEKVVIFDQDPSRAETFRDAFKEIVQCEITGSLQACGSGSGIILIATWSRIPLLTLPMVAQGCHITSLGSDEKGKVELSKDLVLNSDFYCDDIDLNMMMGTPGNLGLPADCIRAEIGTIFSDRKPMERNEKRITVYSSVGLPFQDLIMAWHVYGKALASKRGTRLEMN